MSSVVVHRGTRRAAPPPPSDSEELQEPPTVPEPAPPELRTLLMYLPMGLGPMMMVLVYAGAGRGGSPLTYIMGGAMGIGMVAMGLSQIGRASAERRRKLAAERRDYLRYVSQVRARARAAAELQRLSTLHDNPDPGDLWSLALGPRLWERRGSHEDFAKVRIGLGRQPAAMELTPPSTKPVEDLEPLSAISLRRLLEGCGTVSGIPIALGLRSFVAVELSGDINDVAGSLRAILAQLTTLHAPDELRVAVLVDEAHQERWDWVKWLPHNAHPSKFDAAGPMRLLACHHDELLDLLGPEIVERSNHDASSFPSPTEPFFVVLADRCSVPETSPLRGSGLRGVVLLDASGELPGGSKVLRLRCENGIVHYPAGETTNEASCDRLSRNGADELARVLSPRRTGGAVEISEQPFESDFELTGLLGIRDAHTYDVHATWRSTTKQRARLLAPIGVTDEGEIVQLDLKEPAQGGVGPHGMLIGATGSGKSELLRTLVCGLAATHSSEVLNFVLVDFKGGATFLGMQELPHTSGFITNLSDELPLVDRMQDAINGEMNRRQELLRKAGHASQYDYEKARLAGAQIDPLPSLLVVVDEFSELLSAKPEFMDLFVSIGRLGRSLGVHLLLASQRLDEGRINRVEGHLSYRIALRTFSSIESRSVIGVTEAYELPSAPGNGFLKTDVATLRRFKGAYVSGPCPEPEPGQNDTPVMLDESVVDFVTQAWPTQHQVSNDLLDDDVLTPQDEPIEPVRAEGDVASLADVLLGRLEGAGPPARQIWLPPLSESPTLDVLLPAATRHPVDGMIVDASGWRGRLRVPIGWVDRPFEQARELLVADLGAADGHVGVAGAPQSGKSTALRSLITALALTHTPAEVQIYALDLSGGGLQSISGLPHVGSLATRLERDRVTRTVDEVVQIMERRELQFTAGGLESMAAFRQARRSGELQDTHGDVFLVVDGWSVVRADFPDLETRFAEIASRGLSLGIHLVVAAGRWGDMRPWLRDVLGTRLELRLGDPMESEVRRTLASTVPTQPGRGITAAGLHFLTALPRFDGVDTTDDLADATRALADELRGCWPGEPALPVRMLPAVLPVEELPDAAPGSLCLGLDERRLEPVWHDFSAIPHLLVLGDEETGKTNLLRLVARSVTAAYDPTQAKVLLGDTARGLDADVPMEYRAGHAVTAESLRELAEHSAATLRDRVPGADLPPDRLASRDWWTGAELFVLIDDYDLFGGGLGGSPLEPLLPLLAQGSYIGLHLIIARSTSNAARGMSDPVLRRMWELGSPGVLFSYPKEEGKFLGEAAPRILPAGRAQLVTRRGVRLMQTALVQEPASVETAVPSLGGDDGALAPVGSSSEAG